MNREQVRPKQAAFLELTNALETLAFSPDSRCLAINTQDGETTVYELGDTAPRKVFAVPSQTLKIAWCPDDQTLACIGENEVFILDSNHGNTTAHLRLLSQPFDLAWHPDGIRLAVGTTDHLIYVLNTRTREQSPPLRGHLGTVTALSFSSDGKLLASAGWDGTQQACDIAHAAHPTTRKANVEP